MLERALATAAICLSSTLLACSSPSPEPDAAPAQFRGAYRSTETGPLGVIVFGEDGRYLSMASTCAARACAAEGTFTFDDALSILSLTSSAGERTTLPVEVLETVAPTSSGGRLGRRTLGGGEEAEAPSLVTGGHELLPGTVSRAKVGDQEMQVAAGGCTSGIPTGHTPKGLADDYWRRCPNGPLS